MMNRGEPFITPEPCEHCGERGGLILPYGGWRSPRWVHGTCWEAWHKKLEEDARAAARKSGSYRRTR